MLTCHVVLHLKQQAHLSTAAHAQSYAVTALHLQVSRLQGAPAQATAQLHNTSQALVLLPAFAHPLVFRSCKWNGKKHQWMLQRRVTCIMGVLPPHSSGSRPASLSSCFTLSGLAPSLSTCHQCVNMAQSMPEQCRSGHGPSVTVCINAGLSVKQSNHNRICTLLWLLYNMSFGFLALHIKRANTVKFISQHQAHIHTSTTKPA